MEAVKAKNQGATKINTKDVEAFGTPAADARIRQLSIQRRRPMPHDVEIDILYGGVCHSDLQTARNDWHGPIYPCVPGHEIVRKIVSVGHQVSKFKIGDVGAVGCLVDCCRECQYCNEGLDGENE